MRKVIGMIDRSRTMTAPSIAEGVSDAPRMAAWIQSIDSVPDVILCSSATRTMQTAQLMSPIWDVQPKLIRCEGLYLSSPETILQLIDEELASASRLLVIAHNPGISSITSHLADQSIEMPTAAVAFFKSEQRKELAVAGGRHWQFQTWMRPKALPKPDDTESDSHPL